MSGEYPVGEYIIEELIARGESFAKWPAKVGLSPRRALGILVRDEVLGEEDVLKIAAWSGTSVEFWRNMEAARLHWWLCQLSKPTRPIGETHER